ncbi:hypothetical protein TevJSym_as00510 [endosymbiont of Tevnia jerichonana (vent Tica)]|uniref:Uncharacterized protein n=1 Tax=endosymbiont of Tevnia jerichonana (vent Tica) TaxID=1049564 RepID=G2FGY8_9GAMM|nr:hypothetical protein TevJSym_as00510 [endosymbiont of Tevnia jerichonana (vent Tica)]
MPRVGGYFYAKADAPMKVDRVTKMRGSSPFFGMSVDKEPLIKS